MLILQETYYIISFWKYAEDSSKPQYLKKNDKLNCHNYLGHNDIQSSASRTKNDHLLITDSSI